MNTLLVNDEENVEFVSQQNFSLMIESLVQELDCSYTDALLKYVEDNDVEYSTIAKLINVKIKNHLEVEYSKINYLPKSPELPI